MQEFLDWLVTAAPGPALVGLPVTWTATVLAGAARRWLERLRRTDGLSRVVLAAAEGAAPLSDAEFSAIRGLLEKQEIWELAGRGTVEDLAVLIAAGLPDRGETEALAAGRAIAAGVLEFAVHDLEPKLFGEVLLARLGRLEADQASRLDRELLFVHADLAARLAAREPADEDRFSDLAGRLSRVLDRLPAGPAGPGEVAVYLARLAQWLDVDPWPQDPRFNGPALVPSQIERKLQITGPGGEEDQDADELSGRCSRLVILGDSGTGKTWLARRTARRCALSALTMLADGAPLSEVELPLLTTCARLTAMPPGDGIRDAVVRSAFGQLPDLGGSRVTAAVRELFADRNAPTLVVLDSLDEVPGPDDRIRQADTLPRNWRVILTSRPSSWNGQLTVSEKGDDPSRQKGTLRPLAYPEDVEAFIARWFAARHDQGAVIAAQIKDSPQFQEAATVPLILAFYCIIGGDQPLPASSTDLHAMVINRMLAGRWHGTGACAPDLPGCLETLRGWAWLAAASDPVSGTGSWADEFTAPPARNPADRAALDHVAIPQGPPDPDTGMITRRFAHRSIQEYLVATHVASLEAEAAAEALIGHLWYDPDWQLYAAHKALVLHPQRDSVLRSLVRRVTGSGEFPGKILALDVCRHIRLFLALLADGTGEADWSSEAAEFITRAKRDFAIAGVDVGLIPVGRSPTPDGPLANELLEHLETETSGTGIRDLVNAMMEMNLSTADSSRMRAAVFRAVAQAYPGDELGAFILASLAARLGPSPAERAVARRLVIRALDYHPSYSDSGEEEAALLADLAETSEEQARVVEDLIQSLSTCDYKPTVISDVIDRLDPGAEQRRSACAVLLRRLGSEDAGPDPGDLGKAIARLRPTPEERSDALDSMMQRVISVDYLHSVERTGAAITELAATEQDRRRAHGILTGAISRQGVEGNSGKACLLTCLAAELKLTEDERARVKDSLLTAMTAATSPEAVQDLADAGMSLDLEPGEHELFRVRGLEAALIQYARWKPGQGKARFEFLAELAVTADERARCLNAALGLLARGVNDRAILFVREALSSLASTADDRDRERVRTALLARLDSTTDPFSISILAELLSPLVRGTQDRGRARTALLGKLGSITREFDFGRVAVVIGEMSATGHEKAEARRILLKAVQEEGVGSITGWALTRSIIDLRPAVADLDGLGDPPYGLGDEVLAAIRKNSPLDAWIAALPKLTEPRRATGPRFPAPGLPRAPAAQRIGQLP